MVCLKVVETVGNMGSKEVAGVGVWKNGELSKLSKWIVGIWCGEVLGDMSSVQICQKKIFVHENIHDKRHKYIKIWGQENDKQDERSYILRTHMKGNKNPTYEHDMEADTKIKNTQIDIENHN